MHKMQTKVLLYLILALAIVGGGCKKTPETVNKPKPVQKEDKPKPESVDIRVLASYKIVEYRENQSGSWRKLEKGKSLSAGDEVRTGEKGVFSAKFPDGSIIRVNQNASVELNKDDQSSLNVNLNSGEIYAMMNKITKPYPAFRISTPVVTTGVRGTEYDVRHIGNTSSVFVLSGRVEVGNDAGKYTLNKGMTTTAIAKMAPAPPEKYDSEMLRKEIDAWMKPVVMIEQSNLVEEINDIVVNASKDTPGVELFKPKMTLDVLKTKASAYNAIIIEKGPTPFLPDNNNKRKLRFSITRESVDPVEQKTIDKSDRPHEKQSKKKVRKPAMKEKDEQKKNDKKEPRPGKDDKHDSGNGTER